uniref:ABC transporter n=1 Tax=Pithovirus LCDPAC02 TaxID=2506601 RepID=A0A481YPN4_9VIRU|nr:MAG: ABC transporter [Pithovirus LCDPAC02]
MKKRKNPLIALKNKRKKTRSKQLEAAMVVARDTILQLKSQVREKFQVVVDDKNQGGYNKFLNETVEDIIGVVQDELGPDIELTEQEFRMINNTVREKFDDYTQLIETKNQIKLIFAEVKYVHLYDAAKEFYSGTGNGLRTVRFCSRDYDNENQMTNDMILLKQKTGRQNKYFVKSRDLMIKYKINVNEKMEYLSDLDLVLDNDTGNTLYILGSSNIGKSTLLMYLFKKYYNNNKFISTLFSENMINKNYRDFPKLIGLPEFTKLEERYINTQKYINYNIDNHYNFLNMFDDVIDVRYKKLVNKLFLIYRNTNLSTIIYLQYQYLLSKQARSNINTVYLILMTIMQLEQLLKHG